MKTNKKFLDVITIGFALFSMFFGAGNVIFPPYLGLQSGMKWLGGFAAYYFADVLLALFALFALLREGSAECVMDRVGKKAAAFLMTVIILCIGPMLAIPRTGATTYEMGIYPLLPGLPPALFSILFFALILALSIKEAAVVDVIGKFLTPALLLGLGVLIVVGAAWPLGEPSRDVLVESEIVTGVQAGYQTMDVLAALVFGSVLIKSAADKGYGEAESRKTVLAGAAGLAGFLLLLVYLGLTYLGATVSTQYGADTGRADLVIVIVQNLLGKPGLVIFAIVVALACITTAVALISSAAAHFAALCREKVSYKAFVVVICVFSAVVSNFGLDTIVSIAAPILNVVYPPVLVLVLVALAAPHMPNGICICAVSGAFVTSILTTLDSYGVSMPWLRSLPFSRVDMGWILPSLLCGFVGLIFLLLWRKGSEKED